jgi:hypothetical protein
MTRYHKDFKIQQLLLDNKWTPLKAAVNKAVAS